MLVVILPIFTDLESLSDHACRAVWYLRPFVTKVRIFHTLGEGVQITPPAHLDPSLAQLVRDAEFVSLENAPTEGAIEDAVRQADVVLCADNSALPALQPLVKAIKGAAFPIVRIDHARERFASSFYLKLAERFPERAERFAAISQTRLEVWAAQFAGAKAYVFGTGPNLATISNHDFSDGVTIACNSMIINTPLMERLQPKLIAIADPIFHAGPSTYAAEFRRHLEDAMDRYECPLVVPMRDAHIYQAVLPERHLDRLIAIPFRDGAAPNLDLARDHFVATTSNILSLFLLPIACSFFEEVAIAGCDGRPREQNSYFWAHDKKSQINEEMSAIQVAHPAFFAIDYNDYYDEHCKTLARWLDAAERAGRRIVNLTPSYIPALDARTGAASPRANVRKDAPPVVSIVMPVFDPGDALHAALQSVLAQTYTHWELLAVDDGTTDGGEIVLKAHAESDLRIRYLKNTFRKGVAGARNTALQSAKGKFICFLDADDWLDRDYLKTRVEYLGNHQGCLLTHGSVKLISENEEDMGWELVTKRNISFEDMTGNASHLNALFGRADLLKQFRFREGVRNGEDWWFLAEIMRSGATSAFVDGPPNAYRARSASTVLSDYCGHEDRLEGVINWLYAEANGPSIAPKYRGALAKSSRNAQLARRRLNQFIWELLRGETASTYSSPAILNDPTIKALPADSLQRIIEVVGVRQTGVAIPKLKQLDAKRKAIIERSLANVPFVHAKFRTAICDVFGIKRLRVPKTGRMMRRATILSENTAKDIDLSTLIAADTIAVNGDFAAWDSANFHPAYYCWLDASGVSHERVEKLARHPHGPKHLLVSGGAFQNLSSAGKHVLNFDWLSETFPLLTHRPLTSVGHAALWAALLGYNEILVVRSPPTGAAVVPPNAALAQLLRQRGVLFREVGPVK